MGFFSKYSRSYDDGKKLMGRGEYEQAVYEFDKCIETHGYDSYILQLKAFCLMQLEDYDQAIVCYEIILDDYNYDLDRMVLCNVGIAYNRINKPEIAIKYFDEGIKYYPNYSDFWINKGCSLVALGKYDDALECYEEALRLDRFNKAANEGYNYLCEKLGIEGRDFFDFDKVFINKNHDSISGINASSYLEGKASISEIREDEVNDDVLLDEFSDEDLDRLHSTFEDSDLNNLERIVDNDLDKPYMSINDSISDIGSEETDSNKSLEGFIFCQNCGVKLDAEDVFCSKCGSKLNKIVFCSKCGAKSKVEDEFCRSCGAKLK